MKLLGTIRTDRIKYDYGKIRFPIVSQGEEEVAPNSVGTDAIIDGSIIMDDLNENVKQKIQKTYYQQDEALHMDYDVTNQHLGYDVTADNGDDDI